MKKKIMKVVEYVMWITTSGFVGVGIGCILSKILGEDEWSWKNWSMGHKVIYWILVMMIAFPISLYLAILHVGCQNGIDDFDDEDI